MGRNPTSIHTVLAVLGALTALMSPAQSFGSLSNCLQFNLKAHLGHVANGRDAKALEFYDPDSRYFELGTGVGGGSVYRVLPPNGKPTYVLKEYRDPQARDNDVAAYSLLLHRLPSVDGIDVIHPEIVGKKSMKFPDIEGQTLQDAIHGSELSKAEKDHLLQKWDHFIDKAHASLKKGADVHDHEVDTQRTLRRCMVRFNHNGKLISVWLKADNVIVQPKTGRLFIIDPY